LEAETVSELRVLNLGAGVQSTTIYLMMIDGDIPPADLAIFADTGEEPKAVYEHLNFLRTLSGPPIRCVSVGTSLGDNLKAGINSSGGQNLRHVSIPTFLKDPDGGSPRLGRRQCTSEYKIDPIDRECRRLVGATPGRPIPKESSITQVFGLSFDEPKRVARVKDIFRGRRGWSCEFPLFDDFMRRDECVAFLEKRLPDRTVPRSACVFCPYHTDAEWERIKREDPEGWQRAVEIDRVVRDRTSACNEHMKSEQFLHRSCVPLELVQLRPKSADPQGRFSWSQMDCEGMCGQ
jgi:hypothetical protein